MTQSSKKSNLEALLLAEHSKAQVDRIVKIAQNDSDIKEWLWNFYSGDEPILAQRSSWVIQHIYKNHPREILDYIDRILVVLAKPLHDAQIRSVLSVLQFIEIPQMHAGRFYDFGIQVLSDPSQPSAIRVFGMQIASNIALSYPELASEVISTYALLESPSAGLRSRWKKIQPGLNLVLIQNKPKE